MLVIFSFWRMEKREQKKGLEVGGSGGGNRARREVGVIAGPVKNRKLSAAD